MPTQSPTSRRLALATISLVAGLALSTSVAAASTYTLMDGFDEPSTPPQYDKVGVLKTGPSKAKNILILAPGTSAGAAYFEPLAKRIVAINKGWQVWSIERRENLLEDQTMLDQAKAGQASGQAVFDYYLGWINNPSLPSHFFPVRDDSVPFARQWGMAVAVNDIRKVVKVAAKGHRNVVLGGHSLGGAITVAYATWDFNGKPGADDLNGLVLIDGGSTAVTNPPSAATAQGQLDELSTSSPFLDLAGLGLPWAAGLFNATASTLAIVEPKSKSPLYDFSLIPANLKAPVQTDNEGTYGFALDTETGPANFSLVQMHMGHLADSGDPRGWVDGELVTVHRAATVFSGFGVQSMDGSAWYHPKRLSLDSSAVNGGVANPAQKVLGVRATHGDDLDLPIYAFGAALGGPRVLDSAKSLAKLSGIPKRELVLVNRQSTYAHIDPIAAAPDNAFIKNLKRLLQLSIAKAAER